MLYYGYMHESFTAGFFAGNRQNVRKNLPADASVVLTANGLLQRNADNTFPFRQDSSFWYLTGLSEPDILLVMDKDEDYLIVPGRSAIRERFDGSVDHTELLRISGVAAVYDEVSGWQRLRAAARSSKRVATLLASPPYISGFGMHTNPARKRLIRRLKGVQSGLEMIDIRPRLAELRMIKQKPELAAIQQAIDVTLDTMADVLRPEQWQKYTYEYEVEGDLIGGYRRAGAESLAFTPIVAGGIRACTFHNVANQSRLTPHELVVIDTGAEVGQYAADITRTVAFGTPTDRQRAVFDAVLEAQQYGIGLLKPGLTFREWDEKVRSFVGQKLIGLKLIETADAESIARYYPHYSHFLGLDVHDVGDYSKAFAAGMVLTCEPGIYIPEESVGVRIEDDILITESGHKVLSSALPSVL